MGFNLWLFNLWDSTYGYLIYGIQLMIYLWDSTCGYLIYDLFMRFNLWFINLWFIYDY
jgi:hypothetical protein